MPAAETLSIYNIHDGLSDGLSHFSPDSRAAVIYAVREDDPLRVYDPQNLLAGHELKLKETFADPEALRHVTGVQPWGTEHVRIEPPDLAGLIGYGGRSRNAAFQMWFTEHHPDMCSTGPTRCWLEHAVRLLSHDLSSGEAASLGTAGYVLREYSVHAVRDYIVDERNRRLGWDTRLRIYPLLDAVLNISKTREEGRWPRGDLVFVEPPDLARLNFLVRFPSTEQPATRDYKHVRKLLQCVEQGGRWLASDGAQVVGVVQGPRPRGSVAAEFKGSHGFIRLDEEAVCSFSDGAFTSSTRKANLVHLEEILLASRLDPSSQHILFQCVQSLVHAAQDSGHGCGIVVDLGLSPLSIPGQHLEVPLDLVNSGNLELAKALSCVDGALHVGADLHLHGFACLLDGTSVPGESRARGARYNSAVRFTAMHDDLVVIVVSSDRPVSILQNGVELTASCAWIPLSSRLRRPPTMEEWLAAAGV
ncbi:hypothetical protein dsx2_0516 [Desulfovibrio sp. X2]|uniref:DNA integrity scanning protein DisA nucleotide-binding domain protein n=1 Tax=Desulfovibrio sp. X2 TaxID=941449 RepID=UPI00035873B1|nr:DNA integrity scanning protein DisA nucleotide-binding domain protein [Desulfovibrio sp. X2]EPR38707.1 hypothetical protein dsx2_0516 [Desulfovibrio sp. X2]